MYKMNAININKDLLTELESALAKIDGYGSVELYIQNFEVTQITARNIKKTNSRLKSALKN